ncbi:MAG: DUF5132 domain-containing protein [Xenococcaceae cyanobacterium]
MALKLDKILEEAGAPAIAVGIGAVVLSPILIRTLKPVAKAAIKGGIKLYEKGKSVVAEAGEVLEDMVAEVKAEMAEEVQQKATNLNADFLASETPPPND